MSASYDWVDAPLSELTPKQLHDLLKLRVDVFVVEQQCIYPELDGQDACPGTRHVFAITKDEAMSHGRYSARCCRCKNIGC